MIWYKKWSNRSVWEHNSWGWVWFIDFRTIYQNYIYYRSGVTSFHRTRNTINRKADCRDFNLFASKQKRAHMHELHNLTTILRFTDLNDLLRFCDLVLATRRRQHAIIVARSTAAILRPEAISTRWAARRDTVRRRDGTGQAQKLARSCLENGEFGLRVDRCHLLTIHH
jgi:hypothetical protein